jgi:hypothetical protein
MVRCEVARRAHAHPQHRRYRPDCRVLGVAGFGNLSVRDQALKAQTIDGVSRAYAETEKGLASFERDLIWATARPTSGAIASAQQNARDLEESIEHATAC